MTNTSTDKVKNEFSRLIEINEEMLDKHFKIQADKSELYALAKRFDVHKIDNLSADYIVIKKVDIHDAYLLVATINARVTKFMIDEKEENVEINEKIDVVLLDEDAARNSAEQLENFDIEVFGEDKLVDIGEIAAQYLSLCIFV